MKQKILFVPLFIIATLLVSFQHHGLQAAQKKLASNTTIPILKVNINKASAQEIADVLVGVGLNKAKTIIEYRSKNGSFKQPDDLLKIKGIGPATLKKNRDKLIL